MSHPSQSSPSDESNRQDGHEPTEKPTEKKVVGSAGRMDGSAGQKRALGGRTSKPSTTPAAGEKGERLQKLLAQAGLGSRRACEELIVEGRVEVDGKPAKELGVRVNPLTQKILVDGSPLKLPRRFIYYILHKPRGVITSNRDQAGRPRVVDMLPNEPRVFPVGRLDMDSEGLIVLTNDGDLANKLAHPKFGVPKTYQVQVSGHPTPETLAQLEQGMYLAEGFAKAAGVTLKRTHKQSAILEMVLEEGRNRQVRRLFAKVDHRVQRLKRIALGPLRLGELAPGEFRQLTSEELTKLKESIGKKSDGKRRRSARKFARSRSKEAEFAQDAPGNAAKRRKSLSGSATRGAKPAKQGSLGRSGKRIEATKLGKAKPTAKGSAARTARSGTSLGAKGGAGKGSAGRNSRRTAKRRTNRRGPGSQ